jgi:hypothetical protein
LYEHVALPNDVEPEERNFTTITEDGAIASLDTVRSFFLDTISEGGKSALFAKNIVKVTEITQEVLTLVMPQILFKFNSPPALRVFAETFAAHLSVCDVVPELHIELDFAQGMPEEDLVKLGSWEACELPHGRDINMHEQVEQWIRNIELLPEVTNVHLVFSQIWRDFGELRGLSKKFGLYKRKVTFQFPTPSLRDEKYNFFKVQTMAAVKDIEVKEQNGISDGTRAELVELGCRGFNVVRQRPNV